MTEETSGSVDFSSLVASLAASAAAVMAQVEAVMQGGGGANAEAAEDSKPPSTEEIEKRVGDGLAGARQLIDTLVVLEDKTKGNLTNEEEKLLQSAIAELRIQFVGLANRPIPKAGDVEGEPGE